MINQCYLYKKPTQSASYSFILLISKQSLIFQLCSVRDVLYKLTQKLYKSINQFLTHI
jgi:hypothetical protein